MSSSLTRTLLFVTALCLAISASDTAARAAIKAGQASSNLGGHHPTRHQQEPPAKPAITQGSLEIIDANGRSRGRCPLKHTDVKAEISGFLTRVTVTQQFHNPSDEKIEAVYIFPLPHNSAVDDLTMVVGGRAVRGQIKRREEAREMYEKARASGRVAALLDQERPNIFTQSVANILPGEQVNITISYVETLKYEAGTYEFVFPMVVGQRYISDETKDAERITPPLMDEGERPGHDITIEVTLDAGVPIEGITAPLHEIEVDRNSNHLAVIKLKEQAVIPNQDFVLRFDVAGRQIADAVLTHRADKGGFFTLMLQPPNHVAVADVTPKELVFVLDTSGSMSGLPIETAKQVMKQALDGLYPQDTFNLITFSGDTHILFDKPLPATKENLARAQKFLASRSGNGGTEMMKAIRAALKDSNQQDHLRIVCFMTDGEVGDDMKIIAEVKKHSNARVFAFGIGNSVNRFLLDKMAEHGRGEVEYVLVGQNSEKDAAAAAQRFYQRVRSPLLTDITIDWAGLPVTDVYPKRMPDLFSAKPMVVTGRYTAGGLGVIRLRGKMAGQEFMREIPVEFLDSEPRHDVLAALWARQRIDDLMGQDDHSPQENNPRQEIKEAITQLGLDFHLMTQFTSFVASEAIIVTTSETPRPVEALAPSQIAALHANGVGGIYDSVMVMGGGSMISTCSTSVSQTVSLDAIGHLPLSGRRVFDLAQLAPGIADSGLSGNSNRVTVEGGEHHQDVTGGTLPLPALDAVQEMRIITSGAMAEQGRTGSANIELATRAGTNDWHGSALFFGRTSRLSGLPATFNRTDGNAPSFHRELYAGALGGPMRRDQAFWFGSFEYRQQNGLRQVGQRDLAARTIRNNVAPAPLDELLGLLRLDWNATNKDYFSLFYATSRGDEGSPSPLQRTIGAVTQSQAARNESDSPLLSYRSTLSPALVNEFTLGFSSFRQVNEATATGLQLNFSSLQAGAPFHLPQLPRHNRWQIADHLNALFGSHAFNFGIEAQRVSAAYDPGLRQGRIEIVEDFASADRNGDGKIDDADLLFTAALRVITLDSTQRQGRLSNTHFAAFAQDSWRVKPNLTFNYGLRYEFDTNEKNISHTNELNPLLRPFLSGNRERDKNNLSPRIGFNLADHSGRLIVSGSYGIFYDLIPLQFAALERMLDGRGMVVAAQAGNAARNQNGQPLFLTPTGNFLPGAPTLNNPFVGPAIVWPNAPGLNLIDNSLQNPMVQQSTLGLQFEITRDLAVRANYEHSFGTHFIIGRAIGSLTNPLINTPDRVVNLESSVQTKYDALLLSVEKRATQRSMLRASYTLSKSFNYTNGDQLPFFTGLIDPNNVKLEYGPSPIDARHRFSFAGHYEIWRGLRAAAVWKLATGLPLDILLPDGSSRVPLLQRNAGGRVFHRGSDLNQWIRQVNANGGVSTPQGKQLLPLVRDEARFNDGFNSFDLRLSKSLRLGAERHLELGGELFNLFNVTNIRGLSPANYTGFVNALARDSANPNDPGFLKSSTFGQPVTTAGGAFGSGAPRSIQFLARFVF